MKFLKSISGLLIVYGIALSSLYVMNMLATSEDSSGYISLYSLGAVLAGTIFAYFFITAYKIYWSFPEPNRPGGSRNIKRLEMYGEFKNLFSYNTKKLLASLILGLMLALASIYVASL